MSPRRCPATSRRLAAAFGERLAGIVLCVPTRLDPVSFGALPERLLMICGEGGLTAEVTARAEARLPGSRRVVLAGYDAPGWADVVADRTDEIVQAMSGFLGKLGADVPTSVPREGVHAGISYRIDGSGPGLDAAAVLPGAVAMGAGDRAPGAAIHGHHPGRSPSRRRRDAWRTAPARRPTRRCSGP